MRMLQARSERYEAYSDKKHGNKLYLSARKHRTTAILSHQILEASSLVAHEDSRYGGTAEKRRARRFRDLLRRLKLR
jgi:hypothetical protein